MTTKTKYALELFSGIHSFGKVAEKHGYTVISVDWNPKLTATHNEDILTWDYTQYPADQFETIWCSPECTCFSTMKTTHFGRKIGGNIFSRERLELEIQEKGLPLVWKALEIIEYFKPGLKYWFIENPDSGRLKDFMPKEMHYTRVNYCRYGFDYPKTTRIWNNLPDWEGKLCGRTGICGSMQFGENKIGRRVGWHISDLGLREKVVRDENGNCIRLNSKEKREKYKNYENIRVFHDRPYSDRAAIPAQLFEEIFACIET